MPVDNLTARAARRNGTGDLVGRSACFRDLLDRVERVAATRLPVLIVGETGTGKDRIAQRLHRQSRRDGGPFLAVNCAAFTESLLDAELFGARRGAYTGADRDRPGLFDLARGGTGFSRTGAAVFTSPEMLGFVDEPQAEVGAGFKWLAEQRTRMVYDRFENAIGEVTFADNTSFAPLPGPLAKTTVTLG